MKKVAPTDLCTFQINSMPLKISPTEFRIYSIIDGCTCFLTLCFVGPSYAFYFYPIFSLIFRNNQPHLPPSFTLTFKKLPRILLLYYLSFCSSHTLLFALCICS